MKELIIYGHPRSRTNYLCSHIRGFPNEIFDISHLSENLTLDFKIRQSPKLLIENGLADQYLKKLSTETPPCFKLFGFHLEQWPQAAELIYTLNRPVIRIFRENKLAAVISLLLGKRRGFTSFTTKDCESFRVQKEEFKTAYDVILTYDVKWKNIFSPTLTLEYNEVPAAVQSGLLTEFGVEKEQLYPLEQQHSVEAANQLIENIDDLKKWFNHEAQSKHN